jgi:MerR family transcriptional regulator, thiopeptide resistance regulator
MYTVIELSRMAGVTPRTLHYYDEISLLKPSRVGENGYRYYDDRSVLVLQQILLYRKMDIPLEKIKKMIIQKDFDQKTSLLAQREALVKKIHQLEMIIETVDNTVKYINGEEKINTKQLFSGLIDSQQSEYENEALKIYNPETIKVSNMKWKNYPADKKQKIMDEGNNIYNDLLEAMPEGFTSAKVQNIIQRWRDHMNYFWTPELNQLLGLADLYNEDARFKSNFDKLSPELAEFMRNAIRIYVEQRK